MITNTPTLQVYRKFNIAIRSTACAFLNTQGGQILCYNNGKYFPNKGAAKKQKEKIEELLKKSIIEYPQNRIRYKLNKINDNYFIEILIEKSTSFHYVLDKNEKKFYIRAGKGNKQYNFEQNYSIRNKSYSENGYFKIGPYPHGSRYYKYMSMENALQCLRNSNLWFVEPSKWQDKYERYFYNATINGEVCSKDNPVVYATCVTYKKESESAWKIYSYNTENSNSLCVQFYLDRKKLREALINAKYKIDPSHDGKLIDEYNIYEGVVKYKEEQIVKDLPNPTIIQGSHKLRNEWHHAYFDDFSFNNFLNLLLLKRSAFQHEQETRFFIVKKYFDVRMKKGMGTETSEAKHIDIYIPWKDIILGVRYDSKCPKTKIKQLETEVRTLFGLKKKAPFPKGFEFKPYDVYDAPTPPVIPSVKIKRNNAII